MFEFSNILYLVHVTREENLPSIIESGFIKPPSQLKDFTPGFHSRVVKGMQDGSFDGVFLAVVNMFSPRKLKDLSVIPNPVFIIFPREILEEREDFHINTEDVNGYIIPPFLRGKHGRTFFRDQLEDFIEFCKFSNSYDGEIVFHNEISIENAVIIRDGESLPEEFWNIKGKRVHSLHRVLKFTPMKLSLVKESEDLLYEWTSYLIDIGLLPPDSPVRTLKDIRIILSKSFKKRLALGWR